MKTELINSNSIKLLNMLLMFIANCLSVRSVLLEKVSSSMPIIFNIHLIWQLSQLGIFSLIYVVTK